MKTTGIIRRMDDLGRIIIPRIVRRQLNIREEDPSEILDERNKRVILQKYFYLKHLTTK